MEDFEQLPKPHQEVIRNAIAEAWRNVENGDTGAQTERDVAADVAQYLVNVYGVTTYPYEQI